MATSAMKTQGTLFEIGTGTGSAENITGITLGGRTKIDITSTARSVGDVVTFASITGTTELNGTTHLVTAVETNAIWIDVDSSGYTAYSSGGTATPETFTEVAEVVSWDGPGGQAAVIDATYLQASAKEKLMGLPDEGQLSLSLNFVPSDTGQAACRTARTNQTLENFRITYTDTGTTVQTFTGYVLGFSSSGGVDAKADGSITIEISGAVTTS